ncbi:MAG TPA: hypothetical protein VMP12_12405 [Candidatus Sulfotelmatobacter sp.]|nr:hypothetical protein [Candidatus Sulfotelmatobacter sp.]
MKELTFDIFEGTSENDALWVDAAEGMSNARQRMERIAVEKPGRYFLFSCTSHEILARVETSNKRGKADNTAGLSGS